MGEDMIIVFKYIKRSCEEARVMFSASMLDR